MPTDDDAPSTEDEISDEDATSSSAGGDDAFEATSGPLNTSFESRAEVLSGAMDGHDSESTGELDLPEPDDDIELRPAPSDPGFDGWLDGGDAAANDTYAALADEDDAAAEIAEWVAFTGGSNVEGADAGEPDVVVDVTDDSVEMASQAVNAEPTDDATDAPTEPTADVDDEDGADEPHEDTIEFFIDGSDDAEEDVEGTQPTESDATVDSGAKIAIDETDAVVAPTAPDAPDARDAPSSAPEDAADDGPEDAADDGPEDAADDGPEDAADDGPEDAADDGPEDAADDGPEDAADDGPEDAADDRSDEPAAEDPDHLTVLPVVPIAGVPVSDAVPGAAVSNDDGSDDEDTGEIPVIGTAAGVAPGDEDDDGRGVFDFGDLTDEHYVQTSTRDHQDLAAAIDLADSEDTQQVAISAAIPGLESGVVGFDDVVAAGDDSAPAAPRKASNLLPRVGTGIALIAAFLLSLLWRSAITVLAIAAFVVAAGEFYSVLMHRRFKPMSIFGFIGIIAAGLGSVVWGVVAIPITFGLMATVILLYGAVSQRRTGAVSGFALTLLVAGWIGGFGSFAFPIIAAEEYQVLVLTLVAIVALVDIAAYFVGSSIGRRPFAPTISPKKTIEGFVGGTFMAFLGGAAASFFVESIDLPTGLVLGAAVAVFAPLGDLAVSVVKRSLDIKDMGSILPGHGGLLDRIDAIIAVVPAAWAVFVWAGLL